MKKIQIVDDSQSNIRKLENLLNTHFLVTVARTGEEAVRMAKENVPDLILLEVALPDMDGFETCRRLKAQVESAKIPVIFVSSLKEKEAVIKGFEVGGQDYIIKPFEARELVLRMKSLLKQESSRKYLEQHVKMLEEQNEKLKGKIQKVDRLSRVDFLTNLINRRDMQEKIRAEINRSIRHGRSFTLAIVDIDFFKNINDTYGHDCGDHVLKHFVSTLKNSVRSSDYVSRWGGDEFLLLFPETKLEEGKKACEKIRQKINESPVIYKGMTISITATFGISEYRPSVRIEELIKAADDALYKGKKTGKNQVVVQGM
ncbi:PleD family two-component system response regulator [Halalkalibacterium halodurans]|uniref:diguanylate cyclase n=1 Tax=Halalkalibacterium halodurans TaxID=86665 RepID=UPI0010679962|nr:PleD family two-component system response regulator [Halalkalibacterium halodurans]TES57528.1 PleD family two-component system response regulator [Halalkalibacterium halodurans]